VFLYVDEHATPEQRDALFVIFTGKAGGTAFKNYAAVIGEVYGVEPAGAVSCGIPGRDHPGDEVVTDLNFEYASGQ